MSLFIPFKPHPKAAINFTGSQSNRKDQKGHISRNPSSDADLNRHHNLLSQRDEDSFSPLKKARTEDLETSTKSMDEEGGAINSVDHFALLDELLKREDGELEELVTQSLHEDEEAPSQETPRTEIPKKDENHRNLGLITHRLGEGGFASPMASMADNSEKDSGSPKARHFGFFQEPKSTPPSPGKISASTTPKRSVKRNIWDMLDS